MIAFIGDVHRSFDRLALLVAALPTQVAAVVQVGDLGLRPQDVADSARPIQLPNRPVLYIDGNHDHDPWYRGLDVPTEMGPNLIFVPRGTILDLDNRRVAFLGGGDSIIDRAQRREGVDWWPDEQVTARDVARLGGVRNVDILVSHTPPAPVYPSFGLRPDPSSQAVEQAWEMLGRPATVCGHLHRARAVGRVRVLAELELFLM
jgi:Icc-related predicted phosphoesterase